MDELVSDLKVDAQKLNSLLDDPHPGLMTWVAALASAIEKLNQRWEQAQDREPGTTKDVELVERIRKAVRRYGEGIRRAPDTGTQMVYEDGIVTWVFAQVRKKVLR